MFRLMYANLCEDVKFNGRHGEQRESDAPVSQSATQLMNKLEGAQRVPIHQVNFYSC